MVLDLPSSKIEGHSTTTTPTSHTTPSPGRSAVVACPWHSRKGHQHPTTAPSPASEAAIVAVSPRTHNNNRNSITSMTEPQQQQRRARTRPAAPSPAPSTSAAAPPVTTTTPSAPYHPRITAMDREDDGQGGGSAVETKLRLERQLYELQQTMSSFDARRQEMENSDLELQHQQQQMMLMAQHQQQQISGGGDGARTSSTPPPPLPRQQYDTNGVRRASPPSEMGDSDVLQYHSGGTNMASLQALLKIAATPDRSPSPGYGNSGGGNNIHNDSNNNPHHYNTNGHQQQQQQRRSGRGGVASRGGSRRDMMMIMDDGGNWSVQGDESNNNLDGVVGYSAAAHQLYVPPSSHHNNSSGGGGSSVGATQGSMHGPLRSQLAESIAQARQASSTVTRLQYQLQSLEEENRELHRAHADSDARAARLAANIARLESERQQLLARHAEDQSQAEHVANLTRLLQQSEEAMQGQQQLLHELQNGVEREISVRDAQIKGLKQQVTQKERGAKQLEDMLTEREENIRQLTREIEEQSLFPQELAAQLRHSETVIEELREQLAAAHSEVAAKDKRAERLGGQLQASTLALQSRGSVLEQRLSETERALGTRTSELEAAQKQALQLAEKVTALEAKLSAATKSEAPVGSPIASRTDLALRTRVAELEVECQSLRRVIDDSEQQQQRLHQDTVVAAEHFRAESEALMSEMAALRERVAQSEASEEEAHVQLRHEEQLVQSMADENRALRNELEVVQGLMNDKSKDRGEGDRQRGQQMDTAIKADRDAYIIELEKKVEDLSSLVQDTSRRAHQLSTAPEQADLVRRCEGLDELRRKLAAEVDDCRLEADTLRAQLSAAEMRATEAESRTGVLADDLTKQHIMRLEEELEKMRRMLRVSEAEADHLLQSDRRDQMIEELEHECGLLRNEMAQLQQRAAGTSAHISDNMEKLANQLAEAVREQQQAQERIEVLTRERDELLGKPAQDVGLVQQLREESSRLRQKVESNDTAMRRLNAENQALGRELAERDDDVERLNELLRQYTAKNEQDNNEGSVMAEDSRASIASSQMQIEELTRRANAHKSELQLYKESATAKIDALHAELTEAFNKISTLQLVADEAERRMDASSGSRVSTDGAAHRALAQELERVRIELQQTYQQLDEARSSEGALLTQNKRLQAQIRALESENMRLLASFPGNGPAAAKETKSDQRSAGESGRPTPPGQRVGL